MWFTFPVTLEPPSQTDFLRASGQSVTFHCSAVGRPRPKIVWSKEDNLLIQSGSKIQINSASSSDGNGDVTVNSFLTVSSLSPKDSGNYSCRAFNNISSTSLQMPYVLTVTPATVDHCTPNPCQNGGRCTSGSLSFTCECAEGFTGLTCDTGTQATHHKQHSTHSACFHCRGHHSLASSADSITSGHGCTPPGPS